MYDVRSRPPRKREFLALEDVFLVSLSIHSFDDRERQIDIGLPLSFITCAV